MSVLLQGDMQKSILKDGVRKVISFAEQAVATQMVGKYKDSFSFYMAHFMQ